MSTSSAFARRAFRNRKLAERLGLSHEEQVDEIIRSLFPPNEEDDKEIPLGIHSVRYVRDFKTPRPFSLYERGCILITGGGMCEGGPVVKHLEKIASRKQQASILVTGYMAKGSLGDSLLAIAKARVEGLPQSIEKISIGDQSIFPADLQTKVIPIQGYYSGHADRDGLMDFVFRVIGNKETEKPSAATVFLNHGQHAARRGLKDAIENRKLNPESGDREISGVELPDDTDRWYDLNEKKWLDPEQESKTDALIRDHLNNPSSRATLRCACRVEAKVDAKFANRFRETRPSGAFQPPLRGISPLMDAPLPSALASPSKDWRARRAC